MAVDFGLWTNLDEIADKFAQLAASEDGFGFDIEGGYSGPPKEKYSLHAETAFVAGISFSGDPSWARYIPLRHIRANNVDEVAVARLLAPLLGSGKGVAHHGKHELRHLAKFFRERLTREEMVAAGLSIETETMGYFPLYSDSMIEAYLLGQFRAHGLKPLVWEIYNHQMTELYDLFPGLTDKQKKCLRFSDLELLPRVVSYACEDAAYSLALSRRHRPLVSDRLLYRVEMALVPIVAEMEDYGVAFDWSSMAVAQARAERFSESQRQEVMQRLSNQLGKPISINLGSSAQVSDILYGQLGYKTTRLTAKSQKMSTDEKALAGLAKKHAVVRSILDWREVRKLIGSYLAKYPRDFNYAPDGRTHSSHNQVRVVAGRFSVSEPGYQQLPKKYYYKLDNGEEFSLNFRDFVVAGPDHYLIGFDYSQIELRVLAALSGEPALVKAYQDGADVHVLTAALMFNMATAEVTEDLRAKGKTLNFATCYLQGASGLADAMGISLEEAKSFQSRFFSIYSTVRSWSAKQIEQGVARGYTTSLFGRKHPLWELDSDSGAVRATGERLCVNAPIQGHAADICKIAMVRSSKALRQRGLSDRVHLTMNIHDALVWEVHRSVSPQTVIDVVHPEVTFPIPAPGWPPLVVEWEVGLRWGSMLKLELDGDNQIVLPKQKMRQGA